MPEVSISIGGRQFEVSCQEGEEEHGNEVARLMCSFSICADVQRLGKGRKNDRASHTCDDQQKLSGDDENRRGESAHEEPHGSETNVSEQRVGGSSAGHFKIFVQLVLG